MIRWHIQTIWLEVALTALILSIFITCKNSIAEHDESEENGPPDYREFRGTIDYKVGFQRDPTANLDTNEKDGESSNFIRSRKDAVKITKQVKMNFRAGKSDSDESNKNKKKPEPVTRTYCVNIANTLRARHKSCFLRPDTGPCRADIIQWYYDARLSRCFRFFWGGCQGNGNKFETRRDCSRYCFLNTTMGKEKVPYFCRLPFDFGTCFGHYYRWYWDKYEKTCKRRLYSGCGGNQNNFQSYKECFATCVAIPNDTVLYSADKGTTCFPM